jgi:uncharacterized repeat protein (TIGR03943 family)
VTNGRDTAMRKPIGERVLPFVLLAIGGFAIRLALSGELIRYVKASLKPWLLLSGIVVVVAALVRLLGDDTHDVSVDDDHHHDHLHHEQLEREHVDHEHVDHEHVGPNHHDGHHHSHRVAMLLVLPVLLAVVIAPPPLGSFALSRSSRRSPQVNVSKGSGNSYPALPSSSQPLSMSLFELQSRVATDGVKSVANHRLKLVGFVVSSNSGPSRIARFRIACCAADAAPAVVVVATTRPLPKGDSWVELTGSVTETATFEGETTAKFNADTVVAIPTPDDPYEQG